MDFATGTARAEQRTAARIFCKLSLLIYTQDSAGQPLEGFGCSEIITRDGGLISSPFPLEPGARITVAHEGRRSSARVVGLSQTTAGEAAYGVQLLNASGTAFWGVEFPAPVQNSAGRKLMECSRCHMRVVIDMSEVELMVYENSSTLGRPCQRCAVETLWREPELDLVLGSDAYEAPVATVKLQRTANDRRYSRLAMKKTKACIKRPGCPDDVVDVIDVSRGGIRFQSYSIFDVGMMIEVAVPYTHGGANLFTPAHIVRVGQRATETFPGDYAAAYVR